ncbi:iron-sulfur cluster loop [Desulfurococcaceae archaeon MEX13E-LK6-19]|nr:iron-sulfur cluster loop [Desulfurococcaceae archaeon MEX13E-LK6-19]
MSDKEACVCIDHAYIKSMSNIVTKYIEKIKHEQLNVFDERYYPPSSSDLETTLRYFLVVVALDHRLSRPGKPYEACLEDGCYHGADLLYRIARKILDENPRFYDPHVLSNLRVDEFTKYFNVKEATVPDPEVRTLLLRDIGVKLLKLYDGNAENIIKISGNRLKGSLGKPGLIDLLRVFRAYEDPVEKKLFLLAKFLEARGIIKVNDIEEKEVPVDNHLTRIALRTGIVSVYGVLWDKIRENKPVSWEEDILLRLSVRKAYKIVSLEAGIDPFLLDDFLWVFGRKACYRDEEPRCNECIFKEFCKAYRNAEYMVSEHYYYDTWYY